MRIPRAAIIPSNGRDCLLDAVEAIRGQVDKVLVVWTSQQGHNQVFPQWAERPPDKVMVLYDLQSLKEVNISRWWNLGLNWTQRQVDAPKWDVAVINDDAIVPEGWFDAVSATMRQLGVAAGCSGSTAGMSVLHTVAGPVNLATRMQGFAFMLAGERGLRANEQLKWFFTDDYIDWESRKLGGMVMVNGFHVKHLHENGQVTPEIQAQIAVDAQTFVDLYGMRPW